jgi:membrane associated rhomboid family serine protease
MFPLKDTIPSKSLPIVNWWIIVLCLGAFLYECTLSGTDIESFLSTYGVVPVVFLSNIGGQQISTLFSSMFLHAGWGHVLGNMWFLYIFGDNVEDRMGHVIYPLFYLFTGLCAAATQILVSPQSNVAMVGASGAISGVLGAYFVFYPGARVLSLVPAGLATRTFEVPAFIFLGFWFLMQLLPGVSSLTLTSNNEVGGVAFWAHVGGFASGWILARFFPQPSEPDW